MNVLGVEYKSHTFDKKGVQRHVFKLQLKRGQKSYTFEFGQSIQSGAEEPTLYDVLACLQKYDVGTFENFCGDFGYNTDNRHVKKIYKAVLKEWNNVESFFSESELLELQEIQ